MIDLHALVIVKTESHGGRYGRVDAIGGDGRYTVVVPVARGENLLEEVELVVGESELLLDTPGAVVKSWHADREKYAGAAKYLSRQPNGTHVGKPPAVVRKSQLERKLASMTDAQRRDWRARRNAIEKASRNKRKEA